jgi:hypothetical protein
MVKDKVVILVVEHEFLWYCIPLVTFYDDDIYTILPMWIYHIFYDGPKIFSLDTLTPPQQSSSLSLVLLFLLAFTFFSSLFPLRTR